MFNASYFSKYYFTGYYFTPLFDGSGGPGGNVHIVGMLCNPGTMMGRC